MKLPDWAHRIGSTIGLGADAKPAAVERRREVRRPSSRKVIVRQRKMLGILHLKNISRRGGCGLTDMPLAVGSTVFVELRKPHFFAAQVRWARSLSVGLEFFRPVRPEMLEKAAAPPTSPKKRRKTA